MNALISTATQKKDDKHVASSGLQFVSATDDLQSLCASEAGGSGERCGM